jgi:GH15 family glucan-1,4-alpha-glucosidase
MKHCEKLLSSVMDRVNCRAKHASKRTPPLHLELHPLKDYFLIGDLQTSALVSKTGDIDWLCLPYFDSPSVFAKVLDDEKGGTFSVEAEGFTSRTRYLPYTAIVETTFEKDDASFSLRDFMLPRPTEEVVPHYVIRKFRGLKGSSAVRLQFDPRPNYARQRSIIEVKGNTCSLRIDDRILWLHLPAGSKVTPRANKHGIDIELSIAEGETKEVVMEFSVASRLKLQDRDFEAETVDFWKKWITEGNFEFSREHLVRSAITIKLMQFYPTGGIIASPTTSLPEEIGGIRNWDYRYVWLRDATFTLYAFYVLGFTAEAKKFFGFIERIAEDAKRCDESGTCDLDLSVMYTIWGQPLQGETVLGQLDGYAGSKPVRIGNGAATQFQLDAYGSLIDAYYFMSKRGLEISKNGKEIIQMLVRGIAANWKRKDSGIWEVRGGDQDFTYSKVMAWLGVERALRLADELQISDAQRSAWTRLKDEIEAWIWDNCWDSERGTFKQHPGTHSQDATNFMFVLLFFISRHDPRARTMIDATRKELTKDELYVYRYLNEDGLEGGEGAFVFCMFWQIAAMAAVGMVDEADALLSRIEGLISAESGLMAEEIDPKTGAYLGNHPQAFSHIGYIMSAYYVHRYKKS